MKPIEVSPLSIMIIVMDVLVFIICFDSFLLSATSSKHPVAFHSYRAAIFLVFKACLPGRPFHEILNIVKQ